MSILSIHHNIKVLDCSFYHNIAQISGGKNLNIINHLIINIHFFLKKNIINLIAPPSYLYDNYFYIFFNIFSNYTILGGLSIQDINLLEIQNLYFEGNHAKQFGGGLEIGNQSKNITL